MQSMKMGYEEVESLSLSILYHLLNYLKYSPPLELMVAGYMGIKFGENKEIKQKKQENNLKKIVSKINLEKTKAKNIFTNSDMLDRLKEKYKD